MKAESAAMPISLMRLSALRAAVMLAVVASPGSGAAEPRCRRAGLRTWWGGGFGDGTFVATGAGAGLRLTSHLGLDMELTHLSGSDVARTPTHGYRGVSVSGTASVAGAPMEDFAAFPVGLDPWLTSARIEDRQRDVTTFLTRFTMEFPVASGPLFPYLTGVGRVTERFSIIVDPIPWITSDPPDTEPVAHPPDGISTLRFVDRSIFRSSGEYSELGLSLVLGGGVDVRLWHGLGVGVDLRWILRCPTNAVPCNQRRAAPQTAARWTACRWRRMMQLDPWLSASRSGRR